MFGSVARGDDDEESDAEYEDDLMAQYALAKVMQEIGERLVPRCAMTSRITTTTPKSA